MSATSPLPAPASRSLRASHQLVELEGLRAVAAFAVLLTHAGFLSGATGRQVLPGFLARMDIGVALFFVLSGFLLYRPHARHVATGSTPPPVRTYAVRRAARLVPAWLAVLIGTLFLVPRSRDAGTEVWAANLLQLQSLRLEWDLPGLAQLWSLSTEVMFYAALPAVALLVVRVAGRRGWRAHVATLATLALASWAFRLLDGLGLLPDGYSWLRTLPAMTDWFVAGMVLAVVVSHDRLHDRVAEVVRATPWHFYAVAACVFWVLTTRIAGPYDLAPPTAWQASAKHLGYGVVALLVIAPSVLGARTAVSRVLSSSVLTYLGTISYGLFLWHLPIMFWVRDMLGLELFDFGFWVTVGATVLASVVVAAASWHLLEAPVQAWARGRVSSRRVPGAVGAPRGGEREEQERQNA